MSETFELEKVETSHWLVSNQLYIFKNIYFMKPKKE
jgi:hypothetical protein